MWATSRRGQNLDHSQRELLACVCQQFATAIRQVARRRTGALSLTAENQGIGW